MRLGGRGVRLLSAATASRLADEAAGIAVVLVVIARTADPRLAGLVVAAFALPTLVTGPVLGALLDRLRRKRILFVVNQVTLAGTLLAVLLLAGRAPGPVLVGLGLLAGVTAPVLTGGFSSVLPRVVPSTALPRANAVDGASYNIAGLAGPALVAAVAGSLGAGAALAGTAGLAAVGLGLVLAAPMPAPPEPRAGVGGRIEPGAGEPDPTASAVAGPNPATAGLRRNEPAVGDRHRLESFPVALARGLRLLVRVPLLRATTVATTIGYAAQGLLPVTMPLYAVALGHPAAHGGWLFTAISLGALVGTLLSERLLARRSPTAVRGHPGRPATLHADTPVRSGRRYHGQRQDRRVRPGRRRHRTARRAADRPAAPARRRGRSGARRHGVRPVRTVGRAVGGHGRTRGSTSEAVEPGYRNAGQCSGL
ncbi:hypothetical protein GCM10027605_45680 [Micromonospora zhanjiangensis]